MTLLRSAVKEGRITKTQQRLTVEEFAGEFCRETAKKQQDCKKKQESVQRKQERYETISKV